MQALAFEVLTPGDGSVDAALQARLCALLARAAGGAGMAGGQAIDLASVGRPLDERALCDMHRPKTGALLQRERPDGRGVRAAERSASWRRSSDYGARVGLAFQVVDDILDVTQASRDARQDRRQGRRRRTSPPTSPCWVSTPRSARAETLRDAAPTLRSTRSGIRRQRRTCASSPTRVVARDSLRPRPASA